MLLYLIFHIMMVQWSWSLTHVTSFPTSTYLSIDGYSWTLTTPTGTFTSKIMLVGGSDNSVVSTNFSIGNTNYIELVSGSDPALIITTGSTSGGGGGQHIAVSQ